jgi:chaperone BCS1
MESLTKLGLFNGNMANNITSPVNGSSSLVDTILTSAGRAGHSSPLVHLLLFVYRFLGIQTGLDPSAILTLGGILWGFQYLFFQVYNWVENFVENHLMCSIAVSQDDSIYYHVMEWMSKQPNLNNNRYLTAQSVWKSAWEEDEDSAEDGQSHLFWTDAGEGGRKYLNFSNHAARSVCERKPQLRILA